MPFPQLKAPSTDYAMAVAGFWVLGHCVAQAVAEGGDTASDKVREASEAIARLVRS